jgi:hypothetical protein
VIALLASLIAGGLIAVVVALRRGVLHVALRNAAFAGLWSIQRPGFSPPPVTTGIRFPFALAILAGCAVASWVKT